MTGELDISTHGCISLNRPGNDWVSTWEKSNFYVHKTWEVFFLLFAELWGVRASDQCKWGEKVLLKTTNMIVRFENSLCTHVLNAVEMERAMLMVFLCYKSFLKLSLCRQVLWLIYTKSFSARISAFALMLLSCWGISSEINSGLTGFFFIECFLRSVALFFFMGWSPPTRPKLVRYSFQGASFARLRAWQDKESLWRARCFAKSSHLFYECTKVLIFCRNSRKSFTCFESILDIQSLCVIWSMSALVLYHVFCSICNTHQLPDF